MLNFVKSHLFVAALCTVLIIVVGRFFARAYVLRRRFRNLVCLTAQVFQRKTTYHVRSKPGPPHSWLWGHLKVMGEAMQEVPARAHPHGKPSQDSSITDLTRHSPHATHPREVQPAQLLLPRPMACGRPDASRVRSRDSSTSHSRQ